MIIFRNQSNSSTWDITAHRQFFRYIPRIRGLDPALARKIATGLGAGVGRTGNICGAVSGAILALGLVHGMSTLEETEGGRRVMLLTRNLSVYSPHGSDT